MSLSCDVIQLKISNIKINLTNWLDKKCKIGLGTNCMQSTQLRYGNRSTLKYETNDKHLPQNMQLNTIFCYKMIDLSLWLNFLLCICHHYEKPRNAIFFGPPGRCWITSKVSRHFTRRWTCSWDTSKKLTQLLWKGPEK